MLCKHKSLQSTKWLQMTSFQMQVNTQCCYFFIYAGTFHQYDGIMYPEKPVKTVWSTVRGWFGGSSATEMSIPSHDLVQQQCLHVYLRHHREILLNCQVADIYSFTMSILPIFHQMRVPRVHYYNYSHVWKADGVTQV